MHSIKRYMPMIRYSTWLTMSAIVCIWGLILAFAVPVFLHEDVGRVLTWQWQPTEGLYGILPMVCASILLALSALVLAWPWAIGIACYVQWQKQRQRATVVTALVRFMTTIPTVVYGFTSIFVLVPFMRGMVGGSGLSWCTAMLILALLILPTMVLMLQTAIQQTAHSLDLSMTAMGFSSMQTLLCVVLPACKGWILSAGLLAFGRALGDTLIALMLSGNAPLLPESLFSSIRTLSAHMTLVTAMEAGGIAYNSLFMAAAWLLIISLVSSLVLRHFLAKSGTHVVQGLFCPSWFIRFFQMCCRLSVFVLCFCVIALMAFLTYRGASVLNLALFFGDAPALEAVLGQVRIWDGIWYACIGTLALLVLTIALAVLPGLCVGIYLAEYASPKERKFFSLLVDLLAGIPSIVMGFFGLLLIIILRNTFFPQAGAGLLLSAFCLAFLVLPVLIVATRNALESLPAHLRLTGVALGFPKGALLRKLLLPQASSGIMAGIILAMGRAAEDTAVIILTGAVINAGFPSGFGQRFEALPFRIYYTSAQYQNAAELSQAFGAALVLLLLSIFLVYMAHFVQKKYAYNHVLVK